MHERRLPWVDKLAEAQWFERFGFIAFAGGGSVIIILAKVIGVAAVPTTIAAVALMLVYAFIVWRSTGGRLRADQAGDNLYYLGLLYTLTGLAYAIFTFRPEAKASSIVEGFGIALATTIVGLMLRVFFNQVRADLVEIEDRARMDLAEAASDLRTQLRGIAIEMNDFGRLTRQSLAEAVSGVEAGMLEALNNGAAGLSDMAARAQANVDDAFQGLNTRAKRLGEAVEATTGSIETHGQSTARLSGALDEIGPKAGALTAAMDQVERASTAIQAQAESAATVQQAAAQSTRDASAAMTQLGQLITRIQENVGQIAAAQDSRLAAIESAPVASAEKVAGMIDGIAASVDRRLEKVGGAHASAIAAQLESLSSAVETTRVHNAELASELEKSRQYVAQVHNALVQMTNELANEVERKAAEAAQ